MNEELTIEAQDTDLLDEGEYTVTVESVRLQPTDEYGDYVQCDLSIDGEDYDMLNVGFPAKITRKSQLGRLISEITGEEIDPTETYDVVEILKDTDLNVWVKHNDDDFPYVVKETDEELAIETV